MPSRRVDLGLAPPTRLGPLLLRPATREVVRDDGAHEVIEPRMMQVLIVLAEKRGEIVRRADLIERCWDGLSVGEDSINRVMSRLRRLSEGMAAGAFRIETISRIGYRLVEGDRLASRNGHANARPTGAKNRRRYAMLAGSGIGAAALVLIALVHAGGGRSGPSPHAHRAAPTAQLLPADPVAASLLLQARDDWAERSSQSLDRAIGEFERVTRRAPTFAPGFAGLADAYLLANEAGSLSDTVAFDGAENAARNALRLDPNLGDAHRALAFILYWQRHDAVAAGREFRTAIRLDPWSAQSHFWYANVLADDGEPEAAMREFSRARLIDPGSDQIAADYAWALWISGRDVEARDRLEALVADHPRNAEAQDCLASIALTTGQFEQFLEHSHALARLRREPALDARVAKLQAAFKQGGGPALVSTAYALEMSLQQDDPYPDHSTAAFLASLAGDRRHLLNAVGTAVSGSERWGASGYVSRIRRRWRDDAAIIHALDRLSAPPVEGGAEKAFPSSN